VDELDRVLGSEEKLEPSSGLAAATMERIRREIAEPQPLGFPWRRFVPGTVISLGLLAAGIILAVLRGLPQPAVGAPVDLQELLNSPEVTAVGWAIGALTITWLVWRLTYRLSQRPI
jgi:hypothetical protein